MLVTVSDATPAFLSSKATYQSQKECTFPVYFMLMNINKWIKFDENSQNRSYMYILLLFR